MFLPNYNLKGLSSAYTNRFGGLDERDFADGTAFVDMENMSSEHFPYISPRKNRKKICEVSNASAMCVPKYENMNEVTEFTGVADNYFYYKGERIDNIRLTDGEKEIADFGGRLCIFPDKLYYRYLPDPESGEVNSKLVDMEKEIRLEGVRFYSIKNDDDGIYNAYIQKSGAGFDKFFKTGDSIIISGAKDTQNNVFVISAYGSTAEEGRIVSAVADSVTSDKIVLILTDKNGSRASFKNKTEDGEISVKLAVPDMTHICVHNNRLWGTSPDGHYIYASKLGDCCNFYSYRGLANDSWYGEVGTGGEFTGIVSYRTGIVAFKQNYIHQVYGDKPSNYSVPKQLSGGCIDGRTIAELDGTLFFLGNDGFYIYSGGQPSKISQQLKSKFIGGMSAVCQHKYYAYVQNSKGDSCLLVYDTEYLLWHKEDNPKVRAFATHNGLLYAVLDNWLCCLNSDDCNEEFEWSVTSGRFTADDFRQKGTEGINIRINASECAKLKIYISYNEGEFSETGSVVGRGIISRRIPVRYRNCDCFRIKICGSGMAIVEAIERVYYMAGREFKTTTTEG